MSHRFDEDMVMSEKGVSTIELVQSITINTSAFVGSDKLLLG